jgi:hypothetical protein
MSGIDWSWRYERADGTEVTLPDDAVPAVSVEGSTVVASGTSPSFPSQADAETWIGEIWRSLQAAGVTQVTLLEGDREVYGPMPLVI